MFVGRTAGACKREKGYGKTHYRLMKRPGTDIEKVLRRFPSVGLVITPTPIYRLSRLSERLECNAYVMRDDLTGFAIGGNKVRKLDYLVGDAKSKGADTLITSKASNFSRNAAAAGKAHGFEVHVVLDGDECDQNPASQSLFEQFGAVLRYSRATDSESLDATYRNTVSHLNASGKAVYELHPGGSDCIGALGYLEAFKQIVEFSAKSGAHFNRVFHATGSTATQVGLVMGQGLSGYHTSIVGIAVSQTAEIQYERVRGLAAATAQMIGLDLDESTIVVDDGFLGDGYAVPSEAGREALKMFAQLEGLLLDSVYTGKAAAGLIEYARSGLLGPEENVLFVHTGGNSDVFY